MACEFNSETSDNTTNNSPYIFDNIIIQKDVVYGSEDSSQQILDAYIQGNFEGEPNWVTLDSTLHPVLIFIHGGGWLGGDKVDNVLQFVPFLEKGFNVFSLNYRMGPGTAPAAAEDVICALRWIVDRADGYNLDTEQIYITGSSAGGHLSLVTGFAPTSGIDYNCDVSDVNISGIINQFGITEIADNHEFLKTFKPDWNYTIGWIGDEERVEEVSRKYSPVYMSTEDAPPVLTIHGSIDSVVPYTQALQLEATLKEKGVAHKLITIEGGNHGGFQDEGWHTLMEETFQFIERTNTKNPLEN